MSTALGWQNRFGGVIDVGANVDVKGGFYEVPLPTPRMEGFEGASFDRVHGSGAQWMTSQLPTDSILEIDRDTLVARSRANMRNDPAGGGVDEQKDLVVGTGFTPQAGIRSAAGMISEKQAEQWNTELEEIYEEWCEYAGVTGNDSLWELCRLVSGLHEVDGESVTILGALPSDNTRMPLAVDVIDSDRLRTPPEKMGDKLCHMGIQYDSNGRILGYWIQKQHPFDPKNIDLQFEFFTPDRVIHIFEKWFANQSRGLPAMARTLLRLKDRDDLDEAMIIAAQIKACFAAFVKQVQQQQIPNLDVNELMNSLATGWDAEGNITGDIRPGTIQRLGAGQDMVFAEPAAGGDSVVTMGEQNDRRIAAGLNRPYEMFAKDWRGVSFAGGRIVLSGAKLATETKQERVSTRWLRRVWEKMVDWSVILGLTTIPAALFNQRPMYFRRHSWIPQQWPFSISPLEEVTATLRAVDGNLTSKREAIARYNGGKWKKIVAERAEERRMEREQEIIPPDTEKIELLPEARPGSVTTQAQQAERTAGGK